MKVAYVITELHEGGAENALWQVARRLSRQGLEVAIACCFGGDGPVAERLREDGVQVSDLSAGGKAWIGGWQRLRRWLAEHDPEVVHSWLFRANLLARFACPRGARLICGLRVVEQRRLQILMDRWTRGRVDRYACVSSSVASFARRELGVDDQACFVIENGVDVDFFEPARVQSRDYGKLRGLTVARVAHQKGLEILLQGLARLPVSVPWEWHFVGAEPEPEYSAMLRTLAAELGIENRLFWNGAVPRGEIFSRYAAANVFALPSRWEGQPNVVLEAMAAGLPTLASRTDGVDDLLRGGEGGLRVVDPNEPAVWAAALAAILRDTEARERLVRGGRALVESRSWDGVALAYLDAYEGLLATSK